MLISNCLSNHKCNVSQALLIYMLKYFLIYSHKILYLLILFQHAPGVPKILVGNRLHLAFRRQISEASAEVYAEKNNMAFFEVSPLCDFNVIESFAELSRLALKRNGMSRPFGFNKGMFV